MSNLNEKLKQLPDSAGVYFFKDSSNEIIYVGKAAVLKNRVRQYFQSSKNFDTKTLALISNIVDVDWVTVDSEVDALFVEAEMVRRYQPKYNILLRDDKSTSYIRISYDSAHPTVTITRRPLDDKAKYFGPYFANNKLKKVLNYLRKGFPYSTHLGVVPKRACLQYHLGICPGLEENKTSLSEYRANLRKLMKYLSGQKQDLVKQVEKEMGRAVKSQDFENATELRNQLFALKSLKTLIVFSDEEFIDASKDRGLNGLAEILNLKSAPRRIEGYDISHMQGTDNVASMVVFTNGIPDKANYRKFKLNIPGNDDFAHMHEAVTRRLRPKNIIEWGTPNLMLIDGGKGQLSSAIEARDECSQNQIAVIGLAKREEQIVLHLTKSICKQKFNQKDSFKGLNVKFTGEFALISLSHNSDIIKLLQRIRDESHRFAVSYHSSLKLKRQTNSELDQIAGIGPKTRKKLLKEFGSVKNIKTRNYTDLAKIVGTSKAKTIILNLSESEASNTIG